MAKGGLVFSKDNEYYTPPPVVSYFGPFDYDPATVREKAIELGIPHYDTIETDGLVADWTKYKRIWINPPFTRKHEFLAKAVATYRAAKNDIYILFPIEFLTTRRFFEIAGGGQNIRTKRPYQFSEWPREKGKLTSIRELCYENSRCIGNSIYGYKRA